MRQFTTLASFLALAVVMFAPAPASARQGDERLDPLFERLAGAVNPLEIRILEQSIWAIWVESGSATVDLFMKSTAELMERKEYDRALEILDVVVQLSPQYAEGWNRRATVHYMLGNIDASVSDIERTLELEPRHFGALSGLAAIMSEQKDDEGAMKALTRALAANPHLEKGKERLKELTRRAKGDPI